MRYDIKYTGKNVYISGGSSGIGLACARRFASLGANVFIFARRVDALEAAMEQIQAAMAHPWQRTSWASADVTIHDAVHKELQKAFVTFGKPHVVITCAGTAYPNYFESIDQEHFDITIKTNLTGTWNVLKAAIPAMKEKGGHIVTVSSIAGFIGVFGYSAYCASKFGVIGLSEVLRSELKPAGIRVSVLCPPDTDTPGFALENATKPPETAALGKSAGLMSPDDVANALITGMGRNRFLIIPGLEGRITLVARRLFPGLTMKVMDAIVERTRRTHR